MSENIVPFTRRFPWEVVVLIFEQSDPSTLAALGAVSMDFLQATAPLLYRRVEVKSLDKLAKLFCEREEESKDVSSSRINHLLTLSQIKSFHLNLLSSKPSYKVPAFSPSRRTDSEPVLVEILQVSTNHNNKYLLLLLHTTLFPHFNPLRVNYDTRERPSDESPVHHLTSMDRLSTFDRLTTLDFQGLLPVVIDQSISPSTFHLANLPPPTLQRRRTIRFHLATLLCDYLLNNPDMMEALSTFSFLYIDFMQEGSMVLVVRSEEERKEAEEAVSKLEEGKRTKFAVELDV